MKKISMLLVFVFVLSIAGAAFAAPANPFVDVPAKHWSYGAVASLAKAGIVDGYGDGTFRGDRTMTRYEMAQIVAKALAKSDKADAEQKALIDKLAVEFAAELNNLGVRVAKLEANASSVKMTGDLRVRYVHGSSQVDRTQLKLGLNLGATVNDNVSFKGRLVAQNRFSDIPGNQFEDQVSIEQAYVTVKNLGGIQLDAGRQPLTIGQGILHDADYFDGAVATFGNALKVRFGYGDVGTKGAGIEKLSFDPATNATNTYASKTVKVLDLSYNVNPNLNLTAAAMYAGTQSYANTNGKAHEWQAFGFNYKMNSDLKLTAEYSRDANADDKKSGYWAGLNYKGADKAVPGSYGLYVNYANVKANSMDGDYTTLNISQGNKGWGYGFGYTLAKNVIWSADVQTATNLDTDAKADTWWRTQVKFWF